MKPNFQILDNLRGIAALYVVINHARGFLHIGGSQLAQQIPIKDWSIQQKIYYTILQFTSLGSEFVIFFFVLSGFSIAYSLKKKPQIKSFYKRRFIRIYPPYLLALLWASLVYFLVSNYIKIPIEAGQGNVLGTWKMTVNNLFFIPKGSLVIPFWSLSYEVLFYILAPLFLIRYWRAYLCISFVMLILIWLSFIKDTSLIIIDFFQNYSLFFALGIALYYEYPYLSKKLLSQKKYIFLVIILYFLILVVLKFKIKDWGNLTYLLSAFFSMYCIINFQYHKIEFKWLNYLGKMSYTLYITHFASLFLFKFLASKLGLIHNEPIQVWYIWILGVFFSLFISFLAYLFAEKPSKLFLDWKRS